MSFYLFALVAASLLSFACVLLLIKGLIRCFEFLQRKISGTPASTDLKESTSVQIDPKQNKIVIQPISSDIVLNIGAPSENVMMPQIHSKPQARKSQLARVLQRRKWSEHNTLDNDINTERTGLSVTSFEAGGAGTGSGSNTPDGNHQGQQIYRPDNQEFLNALNILQLQNFKALSDQEDSEDEASETTDKSPQNVSQMEDQVAEKSTSIDFRVTSNTKIEDSLFSKQVGTVKGQQSLRKKLGRTSLRSS